MNKAFGVILIILALGIAILPQFTDCKYLGGGLASKMPCQQSAAAEVVLGIPLAVVGVVTLFNKRKSGFLGLSLLGMVLGFCTILIPTTLIGVCSGATMHCTVLMKPILIVLGVFTVIASAVMLVSSRSLKE